MRSDGPITAVILTFSREAIIKAVVEFHMQGLSHGDLHEGNIVIQRGRPVLIDLESIATHRCSLKMRIIQNTIAPEPDEFGCDELYDLLSQMQVWAPRKSSIFLVPWPLLMGKVGHVHYCACDIHKSLIDSAGYIQQFLFPHLSDNEKESARRSREAEEIFNNLKAERRQTYGTDEFSRESLP